MANENVTQQDECCSPNHKHGNRNGAAAGGIYGLGFIGAAIYFIQHVVQNGQSFWMGVLGFLEAIIWPVILVYRAFLSLDIIDKLRTLIK